MLRVLLLLVAFSLTAAAMPQPQAKPLPQAMRGTWGFEPRACTVESDDGRVEIGPHSVTFFAAACSVESHRRQSDGTLVTRGQCRDEGEAAAEPGAIRLRLTARDRLLIAQDDGEGHVYHRCTRPMPVR